MMFLAENDPRRDVWEQCESPIEQYLCCGLFALLGCKAVSGPFDYSRLPHLAEIAGDAAACFLFSQHSVGIYRADFLAVVVDPQKRTHRKLVIECDGERYHGSDEQIARDQKRDEEIQSAGYRVIRYAGTSLYGDMRGVLGEIQAWIESAGAVCKPPDDLSGYSGILFSFTPDPLVKEEREKERRRYWENNRGPAPADFIYEGIGYRWSDTV